MFARVRWPSVLLGSAVILLLFVLLAAFVGLLVVPWAYDLTATEKPGGAVTFVMDQWNLYLTLTALAWLSGSLVAFFFGGVAAGRAAASHPGFNGAAAGMAVSAAGIAWLLATLLPWIVRPSVDSYTRAENLNNLVETAAVFCAVCPVVLVAAFLGGRLGGLLRRRSSRTAS